MSVRPPRAGASATVLGRRLGIARGVVVEQHQRGRARDDGLLEHLARVHEARGQAADRDDRLALQAMARVEREQAERLDRPRAVARQQVAGAVLAATGTRRRPGAARDASRAPSSSAASTRAALARPSPGTRSSSRRERPARPRSPPPSRLGHVERRAPRVRCRAAAPAAPGWRGLSAPARQPLARALLGRQVAHPAGAGNPRWPPRSCRTAHDQRQHLGLRPAAQAQSARRRAGAGFDLHHEHAGGDRRLRHPRAGSMPATTRSSAWRSA